MATVSFIGISTADGPGDAYNVGISDLYNIVCENQGAEIEYEGSLDGTNFFSLTSRLTLVDKTTPGVESWTLAGCPVQTMRLNVSGYTSGNISALVLSM